ncbi:hypothetical protein F2Q69_00011000 [Brassica cretica]|uniref:Uncharacterized protein n=1 Tax=Brassica cretica TaxID=69181 RepID=A0A8S9QQP7_BRACR|nr:hypothetical protein F2Q69_00011000 [Brassica cretica]
MNFTSQRFLSPSICEYPSLEVVSSPMKKRSDQNQLMDFEMDLLSFQQAKNQEKIPRKYEVMVQSPKPAKPALHLPKLEDSGLTSNQTQFLKPGDFVQIQESLYNILGSTRPHLIKRILKESIQPNQSRLWKDLAIFQFNHFQANQFRPEDIMIKPRCPEDISSHTGESETLLQCNSIHQIIQNQSRPYVPFLESKAINSQQLFSHQDWHDFYPYFCSKEVPNILIVLKYWKLNSMLNILSCTFDVL